MSPKHGVSKYSLAHFIGELRSFFQNADQYLKNAVHSGKVGDLLPLKALLIDAHFVSGFAGLLDMAGIIYQYSLYIDKIIEKGTENFSEDMEALSLAVSRFKEILDAVESRSDVINYYYKPSVTGNFFRPAGAGAVSMKDLESFLKKNLLASSYYSELSKNGHRVPVSSAERSLLKKLEIKKDKDLSSIGHSSHAVRLPSGVLETGNNNTYLTLCFLDFSLYNDLDSILSDLSFLLRDRVLKLYGPLKIPEESLGAKIIHNPYYLLLETDIPTEEFLYKEDLSFKTIRKLRVPLESDLFVEKASSGEDPFLPEDTDLPDRDSFSESSSEYSLKPTYEPEFEQVLSRTPVPTSSIIPEKLSDISFRAEKNNLDYSENDNRENEITGNLEEEEKEEGIGKEETSEPRPVLIPHPEENILSEENNLPAEGENESYSEPEKSEAVSSEPSVLPEKDSNIPLDTGSLDPELYAGFNEGVEKPDLKAETALKKSFEKEEKKQQKIKEKKQKRIEKEEKVNSGQASDMKIKYSIGTKMILMISFIILISLVVATVVSSSEFLRNNRVSVNRDYLDKAEILADSVKEFFKMRNSSVNLFFVGSEKEASETRGEFIDQFFLNNPDIVYIAPLSGSNKVKEYINPLYSDILTDKTLNRFYVAESDFIGNNTGREYPYVFNPSLDFISASGVEENPIILGMVTYSELLSTEVLILIDIRSFLLSNFNTKGLYNAYVLNRDRQIIIHSENNLILSNSIEQRRIIENLTIRKKSELEDDLETIADYMFRIGSEVKQEGVIAQNIFKQENTTSKIYVEIIGTEENERVKVSIPQFLFYRLMKFVSRFDSGDKTNALEISRKVEGGRDLTMVLGEYKSNPFYRTVARFINTDEVNYYAYLKRIVNDSRLTPENLGVVIELEVDRINEAVNRAVRINTIILVLVLAFTVLILFYFSKTITGPIDHLVKSARMIGEGKYNLNLKVKHEDELGVLTQSFVEMGEGLAEKERMKDAFGRFVNEEVASMAMNGSIGLGGERKECTVFFSDIRSFTAISEKLEPEEVVGFLNEYMTLMVDCINESGGFVDKYIGDAIMAVWGAPISKGNDEENCINAALKMRKALLNFNIGRGGDKAPIIRIGCGVNSGPVLAGQIGSEDRMEYTVIGDVVNLASRLEALNKPMGTDIIISTETAERVKGIYNLVPMNKIKVKGKTEPQQIYAVLGRTDDPSSIKSLDELRKLLGIEGDFSGINDMETEEHEVKYEILD